MDTFKAPPTYKSFELTPAAPLSNLSIFFLLLFFFFFVLALLIVFAYTRLLFVCFSLLSFFRKSSPGHAVFRVWTDHRGDVYTAKPQ